MVDNIFTLLEKGREEITEFDPIIEEHRDRLIEGDYTQIEKLQSIICYFKKREKILERKKGELNFYMELNTISETTKKNLHLGITMYQTDLKILLSKIKFHKYQVGVFEFEVIIT